jgi:integrase
MSTPKNRINFTKSTIENLPLPASGWRYYYDTKVGGLAVGVGATGVKTYVLYKKINRRPERIKIGRASDLTVDEARRQAEKLNGEVASGTNPADAKRASREAMTFGDLFEWYYREHSVPHKKTAHEDQAKFEKYLSTREYGLNLAKRRLVEITMGDVRTVFNSIGKDHPITANRVLALVSSVFGKAIDEELYEGVNPCSKITRFKENERERFIAPEEFPAFLDALAQCPNENTRDYIWLSLLTGARRGNVLSMKWKDVSLTRREWLIPDTKNGTPHAVQLADAAIELLKRREATKAGEFVFPGDGKTGHLTEPKRTWKTLTDRAGMSDLRLHDLRRTFGAYQAATGANLSVIGHSLNHKSLVTTTRYAKLWKKPVRDAGNTAVNMMFEVAKTGGKIK